MMYRVMLVDDEPLILAGITSMIEWDDYRYHIAGKAVNGVQALEKMEELRPDIVITDIKMPAMDGITLMKEARERGLDAEFIFLTNLEEFTLAREAVRLGAADYLVKLELTEEKLLDALAAARANRDKRGVAAAEYGETCLEASREEKIRNYFRELLIYDMETQMDQALSAVIEDVFQKPVLMQVHFNYAFESFSQSFTRADQKKLMGFAEDIIGEMVKGFFENNCLLRRDQNSFILVLSTAGVPDYQEQIRRMAEKFLSVIKDYFEVSASVAVSLRGDSVEEFPELLYQVMSAVNHTYYESGEAIVFYSENCEESGRHSSNFNINFLKKDLAQSIRANDGSRFHQIIDQVIDLLSGHKPSRPQAINGCSSLYYFIISFFEDQEDGVFPYSVDIISQLNRMENLNDIIRWTCWFRDEVAAVLLRRQSVKVDRHVEMAQEYVQSHYQEKITLGQVADTLNISQGHLSSTFKKQTGQNFSDYVNYVKVERAKELIETHQYMMYEISDLLGFDTQYYFSTVFKKTAGLTPKEYEALAAGYKSEDFINK